MHGTWIWLLPYYNWQICYGITFLPFFRCMCICICICLCMYCCVSCLICLCVFKSMCANSDTRIRLYTAGSVKYTQYDYATHILPMDILDTLPLRVYFWYIDYIIIYPLGFFYKRRIMIYLMLFYHLYILYFIVYTVFYTVNRSGVDLNKDDLYIYIFKFVPKGPIANKPELV